MDGRANAQAFAQAALLEQRPSILRRTTDSLTDSGQLAKGIDVKDKAVSETR